MNTEELNKAIADFIQISLTDCTNTYRSLDTKRKDFVKDFSLSKIRKLKLDEYVEGKGDKSTFCFRLEKELVQLGSMRGRYFSRLGIYYSKKSKKYLFAKKKYGKTPLIAFNKIRQDTIDLIEAGKKRDINKIISNKTPAMLKGKILSTYYPNMYLNVFSRKYLLHYVTKLNLDRSVNNLRKVSHVELRELLMNFKNSNIIMKKWSVFEFGSFLHNYIGHPDKKKLPAKLKNYTEIVLPPLSETNPEEISLIINGVDNGKSDKSSVTRKRNFEKGKKNAKKIGDRGEEIVMKYEKNKLIENGKNTLSVKVERVSLKSDSYGFDVLSYEINGKKKQIEVKATVKSPGKAFFVISENELSKSIILENYYLYIVFSAHTSNPKIWKLKNPFVTNTSKIKIEPKSHYVTINSSINEN